MSFATSTIRSSRVAVVRIDASGILPEEIRCDVVRPGFTVEVLPTHTRQGRSILMGLRIHRSPEAAKALCLIRVSAGSASAMASITVLH